ncbi:MAG: hypothetical protein KH373_04690 [Ruminococcus sp.]|nr:hypothetical protein [Ruminococcus sp.]
MNSTSYKVALGGIISALCLVSMFLTGVIPILSLALPMIAGTLMMIIKVEVSTGWSFLTYIAVSMLSLFVTFDKESSVMFIFLFGLYPILKTFFDKVKLKLVRVLSKLIYYNVSVTIAFQITFKLFGMEELADQMNQYFPHGMLVLLITTNPVFLMYDYVLNNLIDIYYKKLKPKISNDK